MKRTDFYLKTGMVLIGAILLIMSAMYPILQDKIFYDSNDGINGLDHIEYTWPLKHPLWYCIILASMIVFAIGYFYRQKVNVVLVFVFVPVFGLGIWFVTLFYTYHFSLLWKSGSFCETGDGYTFAIWGYVFVALATCLSVVEKKTPKPKAKTDLLDD